MKLGHPFQIIMGLLNDPHKVINMAHKARRHWGEANICR